MLTDVGESIKLLPQWIRIIYRCWKTRTPYDEVKYLEGLRKNGSTLLNYAANNPA